MSLSVMMPEQEPYSSHTLHLFEHGVDTHVLVEVDRFAYQFFEAEAGLPYAQDIVLEREHSDHMVEVSVGHGIGLEEILLNGVPDLLLAHLLVEPHYVAPEGHDGVDLEVAEREHPLHDVLLHRRDLALVGAFLDYRLYLLLRDLGLLALHAEDLYHEARALGEQPNERGHYRRNYLHRSCDGLGDLLGSAQGYPLGHEFAEDYGQISHQHHYYSLCDGRRQPGRHAGPDEQVRKCRGYLVAGEDTGQDSDQRDAYLYGREEPVRIGSQLQGRLRALAALVGLRLEVGLARRHHGHLRHGEYSVKQNKEKNYENFTHITFILD